MEEHLAGLRAPECEAVIEGLVRERYAVLAIERRKFDRRNWCHRWAVSSLMAWVHLTVMTTTLRL